MRSRRSGSSSLRRPPGARSSAAAWSPASQASNAAASSRVVAQRGRAREQAVRHEVARGALEQLQRLVGLARACSSSLPSARRAVAWCGSSSSARRSASSSPLGGELVRLRRHERVEEALHLGGRQRAGELGGHPAVPERLDRRDALDAERRLQAAGSASTSTLASSTLPARAAAARSSTGVSCLQGPHQSAQKSTTTGTSLRALEHALLEVGLVDVEDRPRAASQDSRTVAFSITTDCSGVPAPPLGRVAELADRLDHVHALRDLAEQRVVGRAGRRPAPVTTKNWLPAVPGGSSPVFAIATTPWHVGRVRRQLVAGRVAGAAGARCRSGRRPGSRSRGRCGGRPCRRRTRLRASDANDAAAFGEVFWSSRIVKAPQLVCQRRRRRSSRCRAALLGFFCPPPSRGAGCSTSLQPPCCCSVACAAVPALRRPPSLSASRRRRRTRASDERERAEQQLKAA